MCYANNRQRSEKMSNQDENQNKARAYLLPEKTKSMEAELRENYYSLLEVTRLLLKQVDQLGQAFKAMELPYKSDETKQTLQKKISEALEICDILRSAADLGKSPNEMIGYYLLGAKQQAESLSAETILSSEVILSESHIVKEKKAVTELSRAAQRYAGNQREEMANQFQLGTGSNAGRQDIVPLLVTKRKELHDLEATLNDQMDELRHRFDFQEELMAEVSEKGDETKVYGESTEIQE